MDYKIASVEEAKLGFLYQNQNVRGRQGLKKCRSLILCTVANLLFDPRETFRDMCKLILKNTDDKTPKTTVPSNVTPVALAQDARKEAINEGKNKEVSKYDAITELLRRKSARLQRSREK